MISRRLLAIPLLAPMLVASAAPAPADLILRGGRIVTVDERFSIAAAIAVRGDRVIATGSSAEIDLLRGPKTDVIELNGRMVLPGLTDSHTHPVSAAMHEFHGEIPPMESIEEVLQYIRRKAGELPDGEWIQLRQVFITRLRERRYPTRAELDAAAPNNPVIFATGPDAALNSAALRESGIDGRFRPPDGGPGRVEVDAAGEATGILRSLTRYVKVRSSAPSPDEADTRRRLKELFSDYLANGITGICDRNASDEHVELYRTLRKDAALPLRLAVSWGVDANQPLEAALKRVERIAGDPLVKSDEWLQVIGIKTFLDGGMLTGSAYMRQPWGISKTYSITDPDYRGLLFIRPEKLRPLVKATLRSGLQFTAHSVGDGAVDELARAYEEADAEFPAAPARPCVTHSNFMDPESISRLAAAGAVVDIQPAWLYLDTATLADHFGYERLRWFQPLQSLARAGVTAGGGSDHMQKIGPFRSVNPYSPFLGMETAVTRRGKAYQRPLHPEEALTREQAIRMYTANNAYLLRRESWSGSLQPGRVADMVIIDRNLLTCPDAEISKTKVLRTYVAGRLAYQAD